MIRIWDKSSYRYIEVEILYGGGRLPWQSDEDLAWLGTGSLNGLKHGGTTRGELITESEARGKGMAGTNWRDPQYTQKAQPRAKQIQCRQCGKRTRRSMVCPSCVVGNYQRRFGAAS